MFQGNWKCSSCGGSITELPFQPRSESGLTCRNCFMKNKDGNNRNSTPASEPELGRLATEAPEIPDFAEAAEEAAPEDDFGGTASPASAEKQRFTGSWKCSGCGGDITSLPFQPRDTSNLKCLDCFKKSRG